MFRFRSLHCWLRRRLHHRPHGVERRRFLLRPPFLALMILRQRRNYLISAKTQLCYEGKRRARLFAGPFYASAFMSNAQRPLQVTVGHIRRHTSLNPAAGQRLVSQPSRQQAVRSDHLNADARRQETRNSYPVGADISASLGPRAVLSLQANNASPRPERTTAG